MKNRKMPFGYGCKDGEIHTVASERVIVEMIFKSYLNGASLKSIAEQLTADGVEYLPCESCWNKSRIKRMIEDTRYSGTGGFPNIIDDDAQEKALNIMKSKYLIDHTALTGAAKIVSGIAECACCGTKMKRIGEGDTGYTRWYCQNDECRISLRNTDELVENSLIELLKCAKECMLQTVASANNHEESCNLEIKRMNNDMLRKLATKQYDAEAMTAEVMSIASEKYAAITETDHLTEYINKSLEDANQVTTELLRTIAESVLLDRESISIKFIDGNILRKEIKQYGRNCKRKSRQSDPGKTGA